MPCSKIHYLVLKKGFAIFVDNLWITFVDKAQQKLSANNMSMLENKPYPQDMWISL
ncbi:hypothetical protein MASR2M64_06540 [Candidatus Cloacimonadota bacterium]